MKKFLVYMVVEVGLVLLAIIGFGVGPLLLWPRWMLSPHAQTALFTGGPTIVLLLAAAVAYAYAANSSVSSTSHPIMLRNFRLIVPFLIVVLGFLYFLPALTLPPVDPTSKPLLVFGPTDEVQTLIWTMFTVFLYVPVTLAALCWHLFTIILLRTYRKRYLMPTGALDGAPQRQTVAEG